MMKTSSIPSFTLKEIVENFYLQVLDDNVLVLGDSSDTVILNYPCRIICMGYIIVLKGEMVVDLDYETLELKKGDLLNVLPNNILEIKSISEGAAFKGIVFTPEYMSEIKFQINSSEVVDFLSKNYTKVFPLDKKLFYNIVWLLKRIEEINSQVAGQDYFASAMLRSYLSIMLYELVNYGKNNFPRFNKTTTTYRKENIAINFANLVGRHYQENKEVQFYADQMHISRKHLTRTVKEVFHRSPKQMIDAKITVEAKILLKNHNLNIHQVMEELNFEDLSVFSKFFKKNTGFSPSEYRRQIAK